MSFDTARTIVACGVGIAICASLVGAAVAASLMLLYDARVAETQRGKWAGPDVANDRLYGTDSRSTHSWLTRLKGNVRLSLDLLRQNTVIRK